MTTPTPKGIILPPARLSAFAEGRMGQYRVPMRKQPSADGYDFITPTGIAKHPWTPARIMEAHRCPYKPGDVLFVKEAFTYWEKPSEKDPNPREGESIDSWYKRNISTGEDFLVYKSDGHKRSLSEWAHPHEIYEHCVGRFGKTIPASQMPAWAARHWLRVESVRAQRVQAISEDEILAEGITVDRVAKWCNRPWSSMPTLHSAFKVLWNSTHPSHPWEANDWCWALSIQPYNPEEVK